MSFTLALKPEAAAAYNARAFALAGSLESLHRGDRPSDANRTLKGSAAHLPVAAHIGPKDMLGPPKIHRSVDLLTGALASVTVAGKAGTLRLPEGKIADFRKLASLVGSLREVREVCDLAFVEESLIQWLESSGREGQPARPWVDALAEDLGKAVREFTFRVPIVGVMIERSFTLGPFTLSYFSRDDIEERVACVPEEHRERARAVFRKDYQGKVYVQGPVNAEPSRARRYALEAAEDVVRALRFLHLAAVDIGVACPVAIYDCMRPAVPHVVLHSSAGAQSSSAVDLAQRGLDLVIEARDLPMMGAAGLDAAGRFLSATQHSSLNETAWTALSIFTRGVESWMWRDRLISALVAAETLLLADSSEPVLRTLGQRMAMLIGGTLEQKRLLVEDLAMAYKARSAFIHHGEEVPADRERLSRILLACRTVVHACLADQAHSSKDDLVRHLDDQLLEGAEAVQSISPRT